MEIDGHGGGEDKHRKTDYMENSNAEKWDRNRRAEMGIRDRWSEGPTQQSGRQERCPRSPIQEETEQNGNQEEKQVRVK